MPSQFTGREKAVVKEDIDATRHSNNPPVNRLACGGAMFTPIAVVPTELPAAAIPRLFPDIAARLYDRTMGAGL